MTKEPDIVRILRREEKLGKLSFCSSIPNQYLEKCELIDKNIQTNEHVCIRCLFLGLCYEA